jgi:diguanylate cyclase (GGDEF)-like protein
LAFAARNQHLREEQNRRTQAGHALEVLCTIDVLRHAQSGLIQGYLEVFQDITEQKERERALILQATCDSLTGLYNRGFFNEEAQKELLRSQHRYPVTLVMIDLDHFKKINDTYGHEAGDLVLTEFSALLKKRCQPGDVLARLGGEELVWLMPHANKGIATERANQLRLALASKEFQSQQHRFRVSASMGVASYGAHTRGLKELLRNADAALYQAKREGRNRVCAWFE